MSNVVNEGKALSDEPRAEDSLSPVDAYHVQPPPPPNQHALEAEVDVDTHMDTDQDEDDVDRCSICLNDFHDRAVLPTCSHEFCFECITIWTEQSRKCPLCTRQVGEHIVHHIRGPRDFQRYFLPPLRTSPPPLSTTIARTLAASSSRLGRRSNGNRPPRQWGRRDQDREKLDELDRAVEKRRWVYAHRLYAKHVASNSHTRYRPFPTPTQFTASEELQKRATAWLRRELRVFPSLDIEWLTTFVVSLMSSLDIRSEGAVKLLAEFLDMDTGLHDNAAHFAHELYSYMRSPYRDMFVYDTVVQYDVPEEVPPPHVPTYRSSHWRTESRSCSRSRSPPRYEEHTEYDDHEPTQARAGTSHVQLNRYSDDEDFEPNQSLRELDISPVHNGRRILHSPPPSRAPGAEQSKDTIAQHRHDRKGKGRALSAGRSRSTGRNKKRSSQLLDDRDDHSLLSPTSTHSQRSTRSPVPLRIITLEDSLHLNAETHGMDVDEGSPPMGSKRHLGLRIRGAAQTGPAVSSQATSLPTSTRPSTQQRPSRGRSLKNSIQAHLRAGPSVSMKVSLADRLSDELAGPDPLPSPPAQDVLIRTRARVASRRGETVGGIEPGTILSLEGSNSDGDEMVSAMLVEDNGEEHETRAGNKAGAEVNGLRKALLDRLEREKEESQDAMEEQTMSAVGKGKGKQVETKIEMEVGGQAVKAQDLLEARLRNQAHLKMRLAKEKRVAGVRLGKGEEGDGSHDDTNQEHANRQKKNEIQSDLDHVEREAALRARLSKRRIPLS